MRRTLWFLLGSLLVAGAMAPMSIARAAAASSEKRLSVCTDAQGKQRTGAIDVVLLLDNSRSLNSEKAAATDPKNMRYGAIRDLLVSLGSVAEGSEEQQAVEINFGMVTFGAAAVERIPLTQLTSSNADSLAEEVKAKSPTRNQEMVTNYVVALEKALQVLDARPAGNCKFLVWFTDGQFERNEISSQDPERARKIKSQADFLRNQVCKAGGLADRFQQLRINAFVLVLRPARPDDRLGASYGAMQAITGVPGSGVPQEVGQKSAGDICGNLGSREHLGEILVAGDAATIARLVPVVGNSAGGWTPATACPVSTDDEDMPQMPASRHLARLSFTAYTARKELKSLESSRIVDSRGREHPFSDYLEVIKSSRFERKYKFNEKALDDLQQGWTFAIEGGEAGWCVQVYHHRFEVSFTDNEAEPVKQVSPGGVLTVADLRALTYRSDNGTELSLNQARSQDTQVSAFLDIDPTDKLFEDPIPVGVKQLNTPSIGCEAFELRDASKERSIPKEKMLSRGCRIDTTFSTIRGLTATLTAGDALGSGACNGALGLVESDGEKLGGNPATSQRIDHPDKSLRTIHVVFKANGRSASCLDKSSSSVLIEYTTKSDGRKSVELPVLVEIKWQRVPVWWVVLLLTLLAIVVVVLVNLVVLGQLTRRTTKLPAVGQVMAYEVPVRVEKFGASQVRIAAEDGSDLAGHAFSLDRLIRLKPNDARSETQLTGGSRSVLRIVYPPLFRPFRAPYLVIEPSRAAYYWQTITGVNGLSPLTKSGIIVHSPRRNDGWTAAIATLLVPAVGNRESLVRTLLSTRSANALSRALSDPEWFGERESAGSAGRGPSTASPVQDPPVVPTVVPNNNSDSAGPEGPTGPPGPGEPPRPGGPPRPG